MPIQIQDLGLTTISVERHIWKTRHQQVVWPDLSSVNTDGKSFGELAETVDHCHDVFISVT